MLRAIKRFVKFEVGWFPFLFAAILCGKVLGFSRVGVVDILANLLIIIAAIGIFKYKIRFDLNCLLFLLYIPLALLLAHPNPIFLSWQRYILFCLICIVASPLVVNASVQQVRLRIFKSIVFFCIIISAISFCCYFLGINMMRNGETGERLDFIENAAGTFGGITSHSMLLGPISGISVIACSYLAMKKKLKYIWGVAAVCMGSLLFSASRSSLIATIVGELVLLYFYSRNKSVFFKKIIIIILFAIVAYPFWGSALNGVIAKNKGKTSINIDSRSEKWEIRIDEWKDSPIWGIGFVSVSDRDYYGANGNIEPGSSWLAVLSMTGIIGFLMFCRIFYRAIRGSLMHSPTPEKACIGGILVMLGVHMGAEGHIFSGGSFLCFLVWLTIGCATDFLSVGSKS